MEDQLSNGHLHVCPIIKDWEKHKRLLEETHMRTQQIQAAISQIHEDTKHLKVIADTLIELKGSLIDAVVGKDVIHADVFKEALTSQSKSYEKVIKILCTVFAVLFFVLLGLKYLAPHLLN